MPSKSKKQHNFMAAVANNPKFAKKAGVPQSVGEDYIKADKGRKFQKGGNIMTSIRKGSTPDQIAKAREADKKRRADMAAKSKAQKDAKAAADAKKTAKSATVDKKVGKKPGGIFGNVLKGVTKIASKKPGSDKKPGNPVTKPGPDGKPTKGGNPFKNFIDKEKSLSNQKKVKEEMVKAQKSQTEKAPQAVPGMKKGGMACKKYAKGGSVSSRADGVAKKGRTKGKFI